MLPLISVVMPAYNAEKYIAEAIESVLQQTFKDWELIIVDDCSIDNTWEIIQKFSNKDLRIKAHQQNRNSGSAYLPRQEAIKLAQSEWIVCLDADDYLDSKDLEILYNRMQETTADIVLHQLIRVTENRIEIGEKCPQDDFNFNQILSGKESCSLTIHQWVINGNGLFKKSLYHDIWNSEIATYNGMNGDELLTRQLFLRAKKVAFCNAKYFYRANPQSITQKFSIKAFDILETNNHLTELIRKHYGENSKEYEQIELQKWVGVRHCCILLYKHKTDIPIKKWHEIKKCLYREWNNINWSLIHKHLEFKKLSFLYTNNFSFFIILIKCWIFIKLLQINNKSKL